VLKACLFCAGEAVGGGPAGGNALAWPQLVQSGSVRCKRSSASRRRRAPSAPGSIALGETNGPRRSNIYSDSSQNPSATALAFVSALFFASASFFDLIPCKLYSGIDLRFPN